MTNLSGLRDNQCPINYFKKDKTGGFYQQSFCRSVKLEHDIRLQILCEYFY